MDNPVIAKREALWQSRERRLYHEIASPASRDRNDRAVFTRLLRRFAPRNDNAIHMKFKLKKYLYFINDVTNTLLNKERLHDKEIAHKLRIALIIISVLLFISVVLNIYYVIR